MKWNARAGRGWTLWTAAAASLALLLTPQWAHAGAIASQADYGQEKQLVAANTTGGAALEAVATVRADSPLISSLPADELNNRLARLLAWVVRDYANSGELRLLSAAPEGANGAGQRNTRLHTLQKTYWLQNNSLYGGQALLEYVPALGRILSDSWRTKWEEKFASFCPDTESSVVVGEAPAYDGGRGAGEARCRLPQPSAWQMLRMRQYPRPGESDFDSRPTPIIGTDYPGDQNANMQIAPMGKTAARDLLKYGCLRQALLGHKDVASEMFDLALAQWDGSGFLEAKSRRDSADDDNGGATTIYWTRDLALAIMCANALGQGELERWGSHGQVVKASIEQKLWSAQSSSGGVWTNYCGEAGGGKCDHGGIPRFAKQTNEIAPLVLLAYGRNIWSK